MMDNLIETATCRVLCNGDFGTGCLIAENIVLTARHCVLGAIDNGTTISLVFPETEEYIAKIIAQSEDLDACILAVSRTFNNCSISLNAEALRAGSEWRSFGYPRGKTQIGHRIFGAISHQLDIPKLKMDIDLAIDPSVVLSSYQGLSGAAIVTEGAIVGMLRLKVDGTIGAISIRSLRSFLSENGVQIPQIDV